MVCKGFAVALCLCALLTAPAHADLNEIRIGLVEHNIRYEDGEFVTPKEDGPNVELEAVWDSPALFELIGSPRPYFMISANTHGDTSFAAIGAYWRWEFAEGWAFEPGFGYAIHNGERDIPSEFPDGSPEAAAFERENQLLGSRDLFRTTLALERELGRRAAVQLFYEHLSHGQILDKGRNQALDEVGVRFLFRFDHDASE